MPSASFSQLTNTSTAKPKKKNPLCMTGPRHYHQCLGDSVFAGKLHDRICSLPSLSSSTASDDSMSSLGVTSPNEGARISHHKPNSRIVSQEDCDTVIKRCSWVSPNSDPTYVAFHDQEWGAPVYDDDKRLFELLVLAGALAEHSWSELLNARNKLREALDGFDPLLIAKYEEPKVFELVNHNSILFHEGKILAIVNNAKLVVKIIEEFGAFSNYVWGFVGKKTIVSRIKHTRQLPGKTPKAEAISRDLLKRGFRHIGPLVIYSFMQASGLTNDHEIDCFRWKQCVEISKKHETKLHIDKRPKTMNKAKNDRKYPFHVISMPIKSHAFVSLPAFI